MSNFQGLLNAVGIGEQGINTTAVQQAQLQRMVAMPLSALVRRLGYDHGGNLEDAFKYAMQSEFGVAPRAVEPVRAAPEPNPNEIASLKMPLSQLKSLWAAKWGEQWVIPKSMDATEDVAFWWNAYQRLMQQDCFETYKLGNVDWRRLKEENGS